MHCLSVIAYSDTIYISSILRRICCHLLLIYKQIHCVYSLSTKCTMTIAVTVHLLTDQCVPFLVDQAARRMQILMNLPIFSGNNWGKTIKKRILTLRTNNPFVCLLFKGLLHLLAIAVVVHFLFQWNSNTPPPPFFSSH